MDGTSKRDSKEVTVFLDRIEELEDDSAIAVFLIEVEEDEFKEFTLPTELLPENTGEGEYLTIKISREQEKTQAALDEAKKLLEIGNEE